MPIKFRCPHCEQFLGISRGKAGSVTDCPTCGRTIRVPDVDGTARPLPQPALNLKDSALASALDALASLGSRDSDDEEESLEPGTADRTPAMQVLAPPPTPRAVVVEAPAHLPAAPRAIPAPLKPESTPVAPAAEDLSAEVARLAAPDRNRSSQRQSGRTGAFWLLASGLALLLFAAGFVAGRNSSPRATATRLPVEAAAGDAALTPPEPNAGPEAVVPPAIRGRITFTGADGVNRPDEGARILVYPEIRQGTAKLSVVGFRNGAVSADADLARASLRSLGGDYTVADAEGQFEIRLPTAGRYQVMIVSRYAPRDAAAPLEPAVQAVLEDYFDRPAALVGQVACVLREFRYAGSGTSPLDQTFERG